MAALVQNLTIVRGDTKKWTITVARNGVAVNLTGAYLWFTAKNSTDDSDDQAIIAVVSALQNSQGKIVLESPLSAGIATLWFFPPATDFLHAPENLQYDIQMQEADGTNTTIAVGVLQITPDVTNRHAYPATVRTIPATASTTH
jgi:hypothetical protein